MRRVCWRRVAAPPLRNGRGHACACLQPLGCAPRGRRRRAPRRQLERAAEDASMNACSLVCPLAWLPTGALCGSSACPLHALAGRVLLHLALGELGDKLLLDVIAARTTAAPKNPTLHPRIPASPHLHPRNRDELFPYAAALPSSAGPPPGRPCAPPHSRKFCGHRSPHPRTPAPPNSDSPSRGGGGGGRVGEGGREARRCGGSGVAGV